MNDTLLKDLTAARAAVAKLETELRAELAALPRAYGFDSTDAFIEAVKHASDGRRQRAVNRVAAAPSNRRKKRRRAVITDQTRAEVKRLCGEGKTAEECAAALRISTASVHNIKRELKLTKKRARG